MAPVRRFLFFSLVAVVSGGLLTSCATNAVRLDRAATMVDAGRTAGRATSKLMDDTRVANRAVLIDLAAFDPACQLPRPTIAIGTLPSGTLFCRRPDPGLSSEATKNDFRIRRIVQRDFEPTLAVITALAGYLDEVDAILGREPLDIGGDLASALSDVQILRAALADVSGREDTLPALQANQLAALKGAFDLLSTILDEKNRVNELTAFETLENRETFKTTLEQLNLANQTWTDALEGQLENQRTILETRLERMAEVEEAKRRPVVVALMDTIERADALPVLKGSLDRLTVVLAESHDSYLDLLDDPDAEKTPEERSKIAKLNHDRVLGALKSLSAIISAF